MIPMFYLFLKQQTCSVFAVQAGKYLPYIKNLIIPTVLLCVYSLLKYSIAVGRKNVSWIELLIEFPIDFLCVSSTLIITIYIFSIGMELPIIVGVVLLLISILLSIGSCFVRRYILDCCKSSSNKGYPFIAGILLYIVVFGWVAFVLFCSYWLK